MRLCLIYLCFVLFHITNGEITDGRLSILPEYDQNVVTILFTAKRGIENAKSSLYFSVPDDVDTVSEIETLPDNNINFNVVSTKNINGKKWVEISDDLIEFAYMIHSSPFPKPGQREFKYNLSFSQEVTNLNLEIQQPLAAEKFRYKGFDGQESRDSNGQISYSAKLENIPNGSNRFITISYVNPLGLTTRNVLKELMSLSQQKEIRQEPVKKIRRHKLYIWEPLFALGVLILITAIVMMNTTVKSLNCSNCEQKLNSNDKYCPKCGEKI